MGNPCDAGFLTGAFRDQDAVISTLGGRAPTKNGDYAVYHASAEAILEATRSHVVLPEETRRHVERPPLPPEATPGSDAWPSLPAMWFAAPRAWSRASAAAELDVTIARCGFLHDSEEEEYRALENALPESGSSVSRQSLAHFLVDAATRLGTGHQVYGVSSPSKRKSGRDAPGLADA